MDRREFLKNSAALTAATVVAPGMLAADKTASKDGAQTPDAAETAPLIASAPMLQNYASTSMGVAFAVSDMANGYVLLSERPDMADARKVKCGGYRVTDLTDRIACDSYEAEIRSVEPALDDGSAPLLPY